ncbi:MAG: hypothetical protein AAB408_02125 [Patescibacteria group bacterium]
MPNKKKQPTKRKTSPKSLERDVKKAVNSIPDLIMDEKNSFLPKEETPVSTKPIKIPYQHKRSFVWIGVASLSVLVFVMWYANMKTIFQKIRLADTAEATVAEDVMADFEEAIASLRPQTEAAELGTPPDTEAVRQILGVVFAAASSSADTASTTSSTTSAMTSL